MNVESYRELVHEDIEIATKVSNSSLKDEFLLYATGVLANGEEFDDFTECHYEGLTRRNGRMAIDGYSKDDAAMDFARDLYYDSESITKYRFYLLTDAYNKQRTKTIKDDKIGEKTVELNVWDITRLYDLVCSKAQKESVEIKLSDFGYEGIPCVKAVRV